jgi:hypothetical protein
MYQPLGGKYMKRVLSRLGFLAVILASVGMVAQQAAYAAPGASVAIVSGSGTISPGLTLTATSQTVSFGGTAVGAGAAAAGVGAVGTAAGVFGCSFSGGPNPPETQLSGSGIATGTCSGGTVGSATLSCTASYTRVGALVVITLTCTATASGPLGAASSSGPAVGVFIFIPTSAPGAPVTSYDLIGASVGAGT